MIENYSSAEVFFNLDEFAVEVQDVLEGKTLRVIFEEIENPQIESTDSYDYARLTFRRGDLTRKKISSMDEIIVDGLTYLVIPPIIMDMSVIKCHLRRKEGVLVR